MDRTIVWILALCAMTSEVVAKLYSSDKHGPMTNVTNSTWVTLWYFRWIKLGMHIGRKFKILLEGILVRLFLLQSIFPLIIVVISLWKHRCMNLWEPSHTDFSNFKTLHGSKDMAFIYRDLEHEHNPQIHLAFWNWHEVGIFLTITIFLLVSGNLKVMFHKMHWLSSRIPESWLV